MTLAITIKCLLSRQKIGCDGGYKMTDRFAIVVPTLVGLEGKVWGRKASQVVGMVGGRFRGSGDIEAIGQVGARAPRQRS